MKKRILSFLLAATMIVGSAMTVCAEETTVINQSSESKTTSVNVSVEIPETFTVTVPKAITLDSTGNYSNDGGILVTGNLAGNRQVTLTVPTTVSLSSTGKDAVDGNITAAKKNFTFSELANNATVKSNLSITAPITAGTWTGSFEVTVSLGNIS